VVAGYIALYQRRYDEVEGFAARAEALAPDSMEPEFLRGNADEIAKRFRRAVERYERLLARAQDPRDRMSALGNLVDARCGQVEDDACEAAHRAYIEASPDEAWARGNFAQFLVRKKRWDEAIATGEETRTVMDYPNVRATLGDAYFGRG
jgi:tetratricopeptide (TPR) repeat protein